MARVDLKEKLTNSLSRMDELGEFVVYSDLVTLDQYFTITQNGVTISGIEAKYIHVGGAGDIAYESPYVLNNLPIVGFIKAASVRRHPILCTRILTTSILGNTTATNLTWHTGE
jgi:hypothetical protein